ncbi:hypothetical protein SERLA73DRAFT_186579 [Serpula lacrymans var. lacrymans S7.3]|uniref:Uncharacterized protein n=2 Tax=Serpula lacrymans var. lacrymans TaxID=341189 RepID=F8Q7I6_SERL3|nr:uncharacterized protein SERLADRAFT_475703 [Serpula lacrymans var. lacrymans S7.9]EGN95524.1 hypothetical protein SERLA73DRAFT_186579 [Serpula lacrymans var. lacrymans S7.3]EGO21051.1 hypothetical protein SERLADRAFT_475703 [Serpula lacrymans var. lacrymans S7.9]
MTVHMHKQDETAVPRKVFRPVCAEILMGLLLLLVGYAMPVAGATLLAVAGTGSVQRGWSD